MTGALTLLRALLHRAGTTAVILLVALCAAAAATVGPTYYAAAKDSILEDSLLATNVIGRSFQSVQQGAVHGTMDALTDTVSGELNSIVGGAAEADRLFGTPVRALETNVFFTDRGENIGLVWREGVCEHVDFASGRCPAAKQEITVSTSLARTHDWKVGDVVRPAVGGGLRIVGIHKPAAAPDDYWVGRANRYFPAELPSSISGVAYDAMFTDRSTIEQLPGNPQGSVVLSRPLAVERVEPADIDTLADVDGQMATSTTLRSIAIVTALAATSETVHDSWSALAIPVVVVTAELLVLTWLLLFLVVTDAVEARGTEIALSKLRGYAGVRSLLFGLGEPVAVLALALPVGAIAGWGLTALLSRALLRDGTPVPLPALGWVAAAVATLGGIAAVLVAARSTLTRPVVEQWRRTGRKATDRGWVFDGVVLTGAVAGLVQLLASGSIGSARSSALALLVPGLLGLAVAVVASRVLPAACRALFGRTRGRGGLGPFLAVRHIARRPGGTRTTMILGTAMALATFSIAAWAIADANRSRVARLTVGAPSVLTVVPPPGVRLADVVDDIDPGGQEASAVYTFDNGSRTLVAVQPERFAAVANWDQTSPDNAQKLLSGLHPPAPPSVVLDGTDVRLHLDVDRLVPAGGEATLDVVAAGGTASTPVSLGTVDRTGSDVTLTGSLSGCPCLVRDLQLSPPGGQAAQLRGTVTMTGLEVRSAGGWQPLDDALQADRWLDLQDQQVRVEDAPDGLLWSFFAVAGVPPTLTTHDRPAALPAVLAAPAAGGQSSLIFSGLDGHDVEVAVVGRTPTVPGAPVEGAVVDLDYATRAAFGNTAAGNAEVWIDGDADRIRQELVDAGIAVIGSRTTAELDDQISRQGPGLASILFLADAAAAAVLAALAAVLSLSAAARRRRYEYAALAATGATPRTLFTALALEQVVVVGFGAIVGVAAGLVAVAIAGPSVPEFVVPPAEQLLRHSPPVLLLVGVLGAACIALLAAAVAAAALLLRSVTPEQLREAPT